MDKQPPHGARREGAGGEAINTQRLMEGIADLPGVSVLAVHDGLVSALSPSPVSRHEDAQALLDWLADNGYRICRYDDDEYAFTPSTVSHERLAAEYLGLDLDDIHAERAAALDDLLAKV